MLLSTSANTTAIASVALTPTSTGYPQASKVTCKFTADNYVDSVYFDGVDITSRVSGALTTWQSTKQVTFVAPPGRAAALAIDTSELSESCPGGFETCGGLLLACQSTDAGWGSLRSQVGGSWLTYGQAPPPDWFANEIDTATWLPPLVSTSGFSCSGCGTTSSGLAPEKIGVNARSRKYRVVITSAGAPPGSPPPRPAASPGPPGRRATRRGTVCARCPRRP